MYTKHDTDENKVKLTITDATKRSSDLTVDLEKLRMLMGNSKWKQLSPNDFIEQEGVLISLSSMKICVRFYSKNKYVTHIGMSDTDE